MIGLTDEQQEILINTYQDIIAKKFRGDAISVSEIILIDQLKGLISAESDYLDKLSTILERIDDLPKSVVIELG